MGWNAVSVIRYAEPYQPTSSSALNCVEIFGIATDTTVVSMATSRVPRARESKMIESFFPSGYRPVASVGTGSVFLLDRTPTSSVLPSIWSDVRSACMEVDLEAQLDDNAELAGFGEQILKTRYS